MKQQRANMMIAVLAALVLCPVLYVGSYFAIVKRFEGAWSTDEYWVEYRIGGRAAELFFAPLHRLDRLVRQWYWEREKAVAVELSEFGEEASVRAPSDANVAEGDLVGSEKGPQDSAAAKAQELQALVDKITEDIESSKNPDPMLYEERGDARMNQEDYQAAFADYSQAIALKREARRFPYLSLMCRARAAVRLGKFEQAIEDVIVATKVRPMQPAPLPHSPFY